MNLGLTDTFKSNICVLLKGMILKKEIKVDLLL